MRIFIGLCLLCLTTLGAGQRLSTASGKEGSEFLLSNQKKSLGSFAGLGDKFQTEASGGLANGGRDKVAGISKKQKLIESASHSALGAEIPAKSAGKGFQGSLPPNPGNPQQAALAMPAVPDGSDNNNVMGIPSSQGGLASIWRALSSPVERRSFVSTSASAANQIGQRRQAEQGNFALQPQVVNNPAIQSAPSMGQSASNTFSSSGNAQSSTGSSQASGMAGATGKDRSTCPHSWDCSVLVHLVHSRSAVSMLSNCGDVRYRFFVSYKSTQNFLDCFRDSILHSIVCTSAVCGAVSWPCVQSTSQKGGHLPR